MRVDFCLSQVLLGSAILCMAFSKQVPAYYLANVCYGFQRSALLSVPFIITDNYVHNQVNSSSRGPVVKRPLKSSRPGFGSRLHCRSFSRSGHTVTSSLVLQLSPCQAPGVIGSALELVGPESVHYVG